MRRSSTLTLGPLVAVMYFTVSGGPFGLEGLVGSVGPGVALLLLVLTPLVFSVPETLLIGELASMLPAEGGDYVWGKRAFGRFWGFWNGGLSWVYSLIDMAIYPVLFLQYIRFFARSEEHTSELQSPCNLVCRLLLEKKKSPGSSLFICML